MTNIEHRQLKFVKEFQLSPLIQINKKNYYSNTQRMKNFPFQKDGKTYWYSRASQQSSAKTMNSIHTFSPIREEQQQTKKSASGICPSVSWTSTRLALSAHQERYSKKPALKSIQRNSN